MTFRFPASHLSLRSAVDRLASAYSPDTATSDQLRAARLRLRQAIIGGELELYAMLSSGAPTRLADQELIDSAWFPDNEVLMFAYIGRRETARFNLTREELRQLSRNGLCLEEKAFRKWLLAERRKTRPDPKSLGRPSEKRVQARDAIAELQAQGRLKSDMRDKEVHALVKEIRPSLEISPDTVRRARKTFCRK